MGAIDHVRYLAETIGPRGSTTPKEAEAARYAAEVLDRVGLKPTTEAFASARSSYYPYALFAGLLLVGELFFWFAGGWGAAAALILGVVALGSVLLELAFRPNPLRWILPKGSSQNVWARIEPSGEAREQIVLLGHLDSHRTPLLFSTDSWLRLFKTLVPLGLVSAVILIIVFLIGTFALTTSLRLLSLPFTLVILAVLVLTLQADYSPYTAGANDNATGAGIVFSLAERLKAQPLAHTAVWAMLSGCEEVGCYGAEAFAQEHWRELGRAVWVTLESAGGRGATVGYLTQETFLLTSRSDPQLLALAEGIAKRRPDLDACAHSFQGAYTEGAIGAKYGLRVFTLLGFNRGGQLPGWHRPTDVMENLDQAVLEHGEEFMWEMLGEIDRQMPG